MKSLMQAASRGAIFAAATFAVAGISTAANAQVVANDFTEGLQGNAVDTFEPETRDPINEADAGGSPPVDWNDVRNGWLGVIEENMSTAGDDPSYPAPDPGALTPEYAVVQPESGSGPYWFGSSADGNEVCYNIDVYADPTIVPNDNGIPDFWWTSALSDAGQANYISESGITGTAVDGSNWLFSTTGGDAIATVPTGLWYEMEVCYVWGLDGTIDAIHTLYDATGTSVLGAFILTEPFLNPVNQTISSNYSWFTNFESNVDVLFVDDFSVEVVPEPTGLALLGLGALALRRRRVA